MKWFAGIVAFLATTCLLFADGAAGDCILSPEHTESSTVQFGGKSDKYKDSRGGWYCTGEKAYARKNGVGLRKESSGALCFDFPEESPEYIATLMVECSTASKTAAAKEHTLVVSLTTDLGEIITDSFTFKTGNQTVRVAAVFNFETPTAIRSMSFTNPGEQIFELSTIVWTSAFPELDIEQYITKIIELQGEVMVSFNRAMGGSGNYTYASIKFCDELIEWNMPTFPRSHTFTAPAMSGIYPVEICLKDSAGNEKRISQNVEVTPYARPCDLKATNITRDGFDLSWSMSSGATPVNYRLTITENLKNPSATIVTVPNWTETEMGEWISDPLLLNPWTEGNKIQAMLAETYDYKGNLWLSIDGGKTWKKKIYVVGVYTLGNLAAGDEQTLMFKVDATPPKYLTINLPKIVSVVEDRTIEVSAQQRLQTITGLSGGKSYTVTLCANYEVITLTSTGESTIKNVTYLSDPFTLQTSPLTGFSDVSVLEKWKRLQLTWPSNESGLTGELRVFAERSLPHSLPDGLYLSRVLWTKSSDDLPTSKAIVLTNISDRPISLRGGYILKTVKRATGTTYQWDFSDKSADAPTKYPYVVPAGGELIIAHSKYLPTDMRETVVQTNTNALNFTADWDISLWRGDTLQNTLTPQTNAVVRLVEDSLTETQVTELTEALPVIDTFYDPWMKTVEVALLETRTFAQGSATTTLISYSTYVNNLDRTRKVWATCSTKKESDISEIIEVILWKPANNMGFAFRMR
jgi:hypothetical protein